MEARRGEASHAVDNLIRIEAQARFQQQSLAHRPAILHIPPCLHVIARERRRIGKADAAGECAVVSFNQIRMPHVFLVIVDAVNIHTQFELVFSRRVPGRQKQVADDLRAPALAVIAEVVIAACSVGCDDIGLGAHGPRVAVKAAGGHARLQQYAVLEKMLILGGEHVGIRGVPLRGGNRVKRVQSHAGREEGIHQKTYRQIVILRQVHLHFGKVARAPNAGSVGVGGQFGINS